MAVIATFNQVAEDDFGSAVSALAGPADSVDITLDEPTLPNSWLGIQMFDSSGDPIDVGAETGGFTITVGYEPSAPALQAPVGGVLDAAALVAINVLGPIRRIKVIVSTGLSAGVATWKIVSQSFRQ
jgi:hypothetical protein